MWKLFKRRRKPPYYEAACSFIGVRSDQIPDFVDAWIEWDGYYAFVVVKTTTRPVWHMPQRIAVETHEDMVITRYLVDSADTDDAVAVMGTYS